MALPLVPWFSFLSGEVSCWSAWPDFVAEPGFVVDPGLVVDPELVVDPGVVVDPDFVVDPVAGTMAAASVALMPGESITKKFDQKNGCSSVNGFDS